MCASVDASVSIGSAEASTSTAHEVSISDDQPRFDAEAWRHIEALRALQLRVSDDETAALAAALARLQVVYSSRAVAAKERAGAGCCAPCKRGAARIGACVLLCAAPALRWVSGSRATATIVQWCMQIYRLYCVAEQRLREWRARYPHYARFAVDMPRGLVSAAFFYGDVFSDALVADKLYEARQGAWTTLCILFILLPAVMSYVSTAAYLHQLKGAASPWLWLWLGVGLPCGVLGLDLIMFFDMSTLLRELPDAGPVSALGGGGVPELALSSP